MKNSNTIVLVVDDEPMLREVLAEMLKIKFPDIEVIEASDGVEAIELFREQYSRGIALVITDNDMPKMTGVMLADLIKSRDSTIPIILATGNLNPPKNHKADALVAKPYRPDFMEKVGIFLSREPVTP